MNQLVIDFNNKGVAFLEYERYEDALDMFLGSMQLAFNDARGEETTAANSNHNESGHIIKNATEKQALHTNTTLEPSTNGCTEDKNTNQHVYTKALQLPCVIDVDVALVRDSDHQHQQLTLHSATILYNTALTYHLWKNSRSSMMKAFRLYEMACDLIAGIDVAEANNSRHSSMLIMATVTNMVHLCNELGLVTLARTYLNHLADVVNSYHHINTASWGEEVTREMEELSLNAILLLVLSQHGTGAGAA